MDNYVQFFKDNSDTGVARIIKALKDADEFNNKVFVIVSDHGHTAMPEKVIDPDTGQIVDAYADCKLDLDMKSEKKQLKEKNLNNNLHIWELGEVLESIGSIPNATIRSQYKVFVPEKIEEVFSKKAVPIEYRPTSVISQANIVAAFNGPMAHIYSTIGTDKKTLGEIAEIFRTVLGGYYPSGAQKLGFSDPDDYVEFQEETAGRLWSSIDILLIRIDDNYYVFNGLDTNGEPLTEGLNTITGSEYIEAELRIRGMNNKDRSGDIVLIMKDKQSDSVDMRYTTGTACKSWHGSLNPSDSYVPLIVTYPGGTKKEIEGVLQQRHPM